MPLDESDLIEEIKNAGCAIKRTKKGHFLIIDPKGNVIESYAVSHPGKREVKDSYVRLVRKALAKVCNP